MMQIDLHLCCMIAAPNSTWVKLHHVAWIDSGRTPLNTISTKLQAVHSPFYSITAPPSSFSTEGGGYLAEVGFYQFKFSYRVHRQQPAHLTVHGGNSVTRWPDRDTAENQHHCNSKQLILEIRLSSSLFPQR